MTPLVLSVSEVRALQQCERRYQHEYVLDREAPATHEMLWGGAIHRGLEGWCKPIQCTECKGEGRIETGHVDCNGVMLDDDCAQCRGEGYLEPSIRTALAFMLEPTEDYTPPADPYARAAASAVLRAYVESWHEDRANWTIVGVEVPFMLPILTREGRRMRSSSCTCHGGIIDVGPDIEKRCTICDGTGRFRPMREGYLDMIVHDETERVWVVERKTTGWDPSSERFYTGLELDLQTKTYFDAARELGYAPVGVIYDVIRRPDYHEPKPPPALKKDGTPRAQKEEVAYTNPRHGESPAAYEARIYAMASARPDQWFARRPLPISEAQVRDAREAFQGAADRVLRARRTGLYPKVLNRYVCAPPKKHGDQRICPWFDVCNGTRSIETFPMKRER